MRTTNTASRVTKTPSDYILTTICNSISSHSAEEHFLSLLQDCPTFSSRLLLSHWLTDSRFLACIFQDNCPFFSPKIAIDFQDFRLRHNLIKLPFAFIIVWRYFVASIWSWSWISWILTRAHEFHRVTTESRPSKSRLKMRMSFVLTLLWVRNEDNSVRITITRGRYRRHRSKTVAHRTSTAKMIIIIELNRMKRFKRNYESRNGVRVAIQSMNGNKSPEQRLNLSRSWHKGHSHAYNTSFFI